MKVLNTFIVLTIFVLVGCTTHVPPEPVPEPQFDKSRVYDLTYDEVWTDLMDFFAENEIPLENVNKESGYLKTETNRVNADSIGSYVWIGQELPTSRIRKGLIRATIFVKKINDNKTSVKVNTLVKYNVSYYSRYSTGGWYDARSTGRLEQNILNSINMPSNQSVPKVNFDQVLD